MKDLTFDYDVGDVVTLSDRRLAVISKYGIYDNQYFCEVCYPDGVRLAGADWFSTNATTFGAHIVEKCNEEKERVISEVNKVVNEMLRKFPELKTSDWKNERFPFLEEVCQN